MVPSSRQPSTSARQRRSIPRLELLEQRNLLTFFGGYRTIEEILADTVTLTASYPDITELVDYGDSYSKIVGGVTTPGGDFIEGYDLLAVRMTNRAVEGPKPVFVMMAGLHPREVSTPEVAFRFLDYFTQNYGVDADVTWMVDHHEIWVIPSANPDGHWYVELGEQPQYGGNPWLWRKNGRPGCDFWPPRRNGDSYGVDLNRNFDDHWGGPGSSGQRCNLTYRGSASASEPETYAFQDLVRTLIPDQRGPDDKDAAPDDTTGIMIDVHTYGGYVLWPWGHTDKPAPNATGLSDVGLKFATYNGYEAGQSYEALYPTTGTSNGWAYTELGIPAYTFELNSDGFLAPYGSVDDQLWPENFGAFLHAARIARAPYMLSRGPDSLNVFPFLDGNILYAFATVNDGDNGGQVIEGAEFYLDTPPWVEGAVALPLGALDGAFDGTAEDVLGGLFTDKLAPGRHILYVRGLDADGNWGPVSAAFVDIPGELPGPKGASAIVRALLLESPGEVPGFVVDTPTFLGDREVPRESGWTEQPLPASPAAQEIPVFTPSPSAEMGAGEFIAELATVESGSVPQRQGRLSG